MNNHQIVQANGVENNFSMAVDAGLGPAHVQTNDSAEDIYSKANNTNNTTMNKRNSILKKDNSSSKKNNTSRNASFKVGNTYAVSKNNGNVVSHFELEPLNDKPEKNVNNSNNNLNIENNHFSNAFHHHSDSYALFLFIFSSSFILLLFIRV